MPSKILLENKNNTLFELLQDYPTIIPTGSTCKMCPGPRFEEGSGLLFPREEAMMTMVTMMMIMMMMIQSIYLMLSVRKTTC